MFTKERALPTAIFVLLTAASVLYFNTQPFFTNPNVTSNLCAAMSLVDSGTFQIDQCLQTYSDSQDKSVYRGHYYSDKPPGLHLLLVPVGWVLRRAFPYPEYENTLYFLRVLGISVPSVVFWCLTLPFWATITGSEARAAALVLAAALGTNALVYSTHLFVHVPAMILFFLGYLVVRKLNDGSDGRWCFLAGLLVSYALVTDLLLFLGSAVLAAYGIWQLRRRTRGIVFLLCGLAVPILVWAGINLALFGHPLHPAYFHYADAYVSNRYQTSVWRFDLRAVPSLLWLAWLDPARGAAFVSPFLLLAPIGYLRLWQTPGFRRDALLSPLLVLLNVVMLTKPTTAEGGWAIGMRYLVPTLPFLVIGVGACLRDAPAAWAWRAAFKTLAVVSVVTIGIAAATFPHFPYELSDPVRQMAVPMFRHRLFGATVLEHYGVDWGAASRVVIPGAASLWILLSDVGRWRELLQKSVVLPAILISAFLVLFLVSPPPPRLTRIECDRLDEVLWLSGHPARAADLVVCAQ